MDSSSPFESVLELSSTLDAASLCWEPPPHHDFLLAAPFVLAACCCCVLAVPPVPNSLRANRLRSSPRRAETSTPSLEHSEEERASRRLRSTLDSSRSPQTVSSTPERSSSAKLTALVLLDAARRCCCSVLSLPPRAARRRGRRGVAISHHKVDGLPEKYLFDVKNLKCCDLDSQRPQIVNSKQP